MSQKTSLSTPHASAWSIEDILSHAQSGRLLVPEFQRNFRWGRKDILKLFDSLYHGYPIGNLLVWDTEPPPQSLSRFGPLSFARSDRGALIIIDGQQRTTSLVASLLGGGEEDGKFHVHFDLEAREFKQPSLRGRIPPTWLPMTAVSDTIKYLEWLQVRELPPALVRTANEVVRSIRDYKVPVYTVRGGQEQEGLIREIFKRLNTTGKALIEAEIFNAIHGGAERGGLAAVSSALESERFGRLNDTWLLKALAATLDLERSKQLTTLFSDKSPKERAEALERAQSALRLVVRFLRDDSAIVHWSLLPYRFPIIPLTAFFARFPTPGRAARTDLRIWLWEGARSGQHAVITRPIVRAALDYIKKASSAELAGQRLRESLLQGEMEFELRPHNFRTASTKIVCCVLAGLGPRDLMSGELLDLTSLLEEKHPLAQIVVRKDAGSEARILHPPLTTRPISNARQLVDLLCRTEVDAPALESHGIGRRAAGHLRDGDVDGFLRWRRRDLGEAIDNFLARMCGQ